MELSDLIARLEAAEGPDRELDAEIWCWRHPEYQMRKNGFTKHPGRFVQSESPRYTASVDAALTLVPEGWSWRIGNLPSSRAFADLGTQKSLQCIVGATPALALCIAALRARDGGK